ncbi:stage II sporulation protein D [Hazenella sp. IB182357]|uniref:Stage II sporulation protein D n=1 Tax=Polycladospora coralii TaxID=2771432 RepID=A0A926NEX7_9BACL|nr:stage II sporulation protein D [Polycladospora coralii]MBD1372168.1 stage II sporulation protein D [Polycladospora coralii]
MQKKLLWVLPVLIVTILFVPTILVYLSPAKQITTVKAVETVRNNDEPKNHYPAPTVRVYLTKEKKVIALPLEEYIRGVVASEMPSEFHKEALKAQALAARTYIVDRLMKEELSDMKTMGKTAESAHVSDTVKHQVYTTDEKLIQKWGNQAAVYMQRIKEAVTETEGQIITYEDQPIYAAFFSTSNGKTENSEEYFKSAVPYLRSVDSSWDTSSPKYEKKIKMSLHDLSKQLSTVTGKQISIDTTTSNHFLKITKRTEGNRVAEVRIGDELFSGREVREALKLASTDFEMTITGDQVSVVTKGYGHGVGMSQWGAHLLAQNGSNANQIVTHYYQGIKVKEIKPTLAQIAQSK